MNFNSWLMMQIHRRKTNQVIFAQQIAAHRQTVVKWLNGTAKPSPEFITRIAAFLAGTEPEPWNAIPQMKKDLVQTITALTTSDVGLCPCCGVVVAKEDLDG